MLNYIWGEQRLRVNKRMLYTPRLWGGLGKPDLINYFQDAQLSPLIRFHSETYCPIWMQLESSILPIERSDSWCGCKSRTILLSFAPLFLSLLACGTDWLLQTISNLLILPWPLYLTSPMSPRALFPKTSYGELIIKGFSWSLRSFVHASFERKHDLPHTESFRYAQIAHFITSFEEEFRFFH